ncbi:alpha/beta fold hydrolase [Alteromonadaceae bacterium M269]|nr:alpha/beta fold hydrolase [Alteromonadaceae bacterium M269]
MNMKQLFILLCLALIPQTYASNSDALRSDPQHIDKEYPPSIVELSFDSYGSELNGHLYQANGKGPHPTVVMLHGLPGNEKNLDLAQALRRSGFNVLFFHYRGSWGSEGYYSFSNVIEDVASALTFMRSDKAINDYRVDADKLILLGHSMGGFAALQGSARDADIQCTVGLAAANFGARIASEDALNGLVNYTENLGPLNTKQNSIANDIKKNRDSFDVHNLAPQLKGKSILLIAGDSDTVLPPATIHTPMVAAFRKEADIKLTDIILPGDHSFSWSRFKLAETVVPWLKEHCL